MRENYSIPLQRRRTQTRFGLHWRLLLCVCLALPTAPSVLAQDRVITGKVSDAKENNPLPGVSILVKGSQRGTVTDADGSFSVNASSTDVLVISFIGFETQEIPVGDRTNVAVTMHESVSTLNEVVVTALGMSQEKRSLGYSVQEVKGDDIAQTQRPSFMTSLQGRVAGLSMISTSGLPGSSTSITLRGVGSISGNNQPLIVVDGLPVDNRVLDQHNLVSNGDNRNNDYTNRAADINPNDIASITVLKGPEAAALYGQGGASGALLITTKKGSKGARVTYDNNFGFQQLYRFPKTQTTYGLGDFGYFNATNFTSDLLYFGPKYDDAAKRYDNVNSFFKTGTSQTHNVIVEGGNDVMTNRLSVNYYNQDGVVPTSHYDKLSARLTSATKIANKLEVTTTLNYVLTNNTKPLRGPNGFVLSSLWWPATDDMSQYLNADGTRRRLIPDTPSPATTYAEPNNPFFSVYKNINKDRTNRIMANLSVSYDPLKWLNVVGRLGADIYSTQGNSFSHPEGVGEVIVVSGAPNYLLNRGTIENYFENSKLVNGQLLVTGKKQFGDFKTTLLVGGSFDDKLYEANAVMGQQLLLKEYNSLNNTTPSTRSFKQTIIDQRSVSMFSNLSVGYKDIAYLTLTGRNDWSSTMPIANNSYFYPSVALSFVFTELDALKNLGPLSYGKLRASYAEVGKDAPPYKVQSSLINRNYTGGGFAYDFYGGNPALKPERAKGNEIGAELKFFGGRLGLDIAAYQNDRINQISTQRLSYGTGFVFGLLNGGHLSVRGFEVQLSTKPIVTSNFEWNVMANFSKAKSKVIELPAQVKEYYNSDTWILGNARGSMFPSNEQSFFNPASYPYYNWDYLQRGLGSGTAIGGFTYERNKNGDIMINPTTGLPYKTADFLPIGERQPDFMIGLTNSFRYKNFNLSFLLDIRKGGDIFNGNEMYLWQNGLSTRSLNREKPVVFNGVLKDGKENTSTPTRNTIQLTPYTMGSTYYAAYAESDFVEHNINWLRLRDVTLAYTLPQNVMSKVKALRTASVFMTCTDLFLLTNYTGADPMVNGTTPATTGAGAFGFDYGSLSIPRTLTAGIRISM